MRWRLPALAALAALAGAALLAASPASVAATGAGSLQLTPLPSTFPDRSYRLSLPHRVQVDPSTVQLVENGQPVNNLQIQPPSGNSATMLLIDSSLTMTGKPIADAMAAARAFAAQRNAEQQVAVATFNKKVRLLLPYSSNDGEIAQALAKTPTTAYGTVIYDAVLYALDSIQHNGASNGTIVLLTDGQNVGSVNTLAAALKRLRGSNIRLFSVGLLSPAFNPAPLRRMARASGGAYAEASSSKALEGIYTALGERLANEYTVDYRSLAGPAQKIYVAVKVAGFSSVASSSYLSPGLPPGLNTKQSWFDRFIRSTTAMALVIAFSVLLIGLAVYLFARRRDRRFELRLSRFVTLTPDEQARARRASIAGSLEEEPEGKRWNLNDALHRLGEDVELSRIPVKPAAVLGLTAVGTVFVGAVVAALVSSGWGLLFGLVVPLIVRWFIGFKLARVRRAFAEQLPDNIDVIASALRAGHSLVGALTVTVEASDEPSRSELGRALADEQLGIPLDDALHVVAKRMDNRDLRQVAMVSMLQREAGTNAAEVLDRVAENVRAQIDLKRLVRTLTAQGRMARWIVSFLPLFLFLALYLINKSYLSPLWQTNGGIAALVVAGIMVVAGSLVIRRIVEIEV